MRQRNHAFDLLCGLCILRMVTLHAVCLTALRNEEWWRAVMEWSFFFMSFFFFKAGYFNKGVAGDSRAYCRDKFRRLMVPYFAWGTVSAAVYLGFMLAFPERLPRLAAGLARFRWWVGGYTLGNSALWFLLSFFASYILVHFLEKARGLRWAALAFPAAGYWLFTLGNPLWLQLNNVFCGAFFFLLGKLWRRALEAMGRRRGLWLSLALTAAFAAANVWAHGEYEMRTNTWTGHPAHVMACVTLALLGLSGTLLCAGAPRVPVVNHIGEHSMVYFVAHYPVLFSYCSLAAVAGCPVRHSMAHLGAMLALAFGVCALLVRRVESVPWLSGRFRKGS